MKKKLKEKFLFFLLFILIFILISQNFFLQKKEVHYVYQEFFRKEVEIKIPAIARIGREEKGVITTLKVQAIPGTGKTLTNIDNILFWVDTQHSIRIAKQVAERISKISASNLDLMYTIETEASLIGGQSAGAAIAIATIAILENKTLNPNVAITGTIEADGRIGIVGGIIEKAKAVKEFGIELFLVPEGQSSMVTYKPEEKCERIGLITFCRTEYKPQKIEISEIVGIETKEVRNIEEALKYFFA